MKPVALFSTLLFAALCPALAAATGTSPAVTAAWVRTATVRVRAVAQTLPAYGSLVPAAGKRIALAAPRDSRIVAVAVSSGERVRKGQALLTLAPTPQSRAAWVQAKSAAGYARSALARTRRLYAEHLATRDQLAAAEKALEDATAALAAATQAGGGGNLTLRAAAKGVVTAVAVSPGERVAANAPLMSLIADGGLQARLGVAPALASELHPGMAVNLAAVFDSAARVSGKIAAVGGMVDPATGLVDVFVPLAPASRGFFPGGAVQAEITLSVAHALAVPRSALLRDARGAYVFIVKDGIARRVAVRTGNDDGQWIAVRGALKAGDAVVTLGNYELTDGMRVREQAP